MRVYLFSLTILLCLLCSCSEEKPAESPEKNTLTEASTDTMVEMEVSDIMEDEEPVSGDEIIVLKPEIIKDAYDLSEQALKEFERATEVLDRIESGAATYESLSDSEKELYDGFEENEGVDPFVLSPFYLTGCAMEPEGLRANSSLPDSKNNSYGAENLVDRDLRTAWVEGREGYGIGDEIFYNFSSMGNESNQLHQLGIINGYVKNPESWKANSRVKTLSFWHNEYEIARLELQDIPELQVFDLNDFKEDWGPKPIFALRIEDVYKGEKYADVAITEMTFAYFACQCFAAGTEILMADHSLKTIESLEEGDIVMGIDPTYGEQFPSKVLALANPLHETLYELQLENGKNIRLTADHPIWVGGTKGYWASLQPKISQFYEAMEHIEELKPGDKISTVDGTLQRIMTIQKIEKLQTTYTISRLSKGHAFIANGLIVAVEGAPDLP